MLYFVFRLIETESKETAAVLQVIHISLTDVGKACLDARANFEKCRLFYKQLATIVPEGSFYRFHDHWNWTTQRLISQIALVVYLEAGKEMSIINYLFAFKITVYSRISCNARNLCRNLRIRKSTFSRIPPS